MVEVVHNPPTPPVAMQLRPYQVRWVQDDSRFKLSVKSARIGYSFATALRAVLKCIQHPKKTVTVLSASKDQSVEFVGTCNSHRELLGAVAQVYENENFVDAVDSSEHYQMRVQFPNGSRIIALPANPRTARGYPGDAILDEFAHHQQSYQIWAAIIRQTALGHGLEALSTCNGEQGKFYDLAKELGLDLVANAPGANEGFDPVIVRKGPWSGHWVDVYMAVREGCPINIPEMQAGVGDDETWQQEFCCIFLKAAGAWIPLELVASCEDDEATVELQPALRMRGFVTGGIDVARDHDATCFWMDEKIGDVQWTRHVLWIHATSFPKQFQLLSPLVAMCDRVAIDATGMGVALYDYLNEAYPGRIIGVNFAGTKPRDEQPSILSTKDKAGESIRMKTALAIGLKKQMEAAKCRLPHSQQIRNELTSIKRESTGGGVRFDAPRIETDSAVAGGVKKKRFAHADAFWAKALSAFASETSVLSTDFTTSGVASNYRTSGAIL